MKATELMIGDLVYGLCPNGSRYANPFRISAVDIYPLNRSPRIVTNGRYGFHEEHLEPIPLTPEILEKNGWEKSIGENPVEVWTIKKGVYLHNTDNGYKLREGAEFNVPNIKYVHTLQHCLRLCGLNDLADNLKIE